MVALNTIHIHPPLLNSSCAWSSDLHQLKELYESPYTGALTTRTATLNGFEENLNHKVAFSSETITTINSYGYSPHPLSEYVKWVEIILTSHPLSLKPIIISVTAAEPGELKLIVDSIQELRRKLLDEKSVRSRIAIELNTSCPNIPDSPPSGYTFQSLTPLLQVLAANCAQDPTLTIGLKLPPYVYKDQFKQVFAELQVLGADRKENKSSIAFLTCTNTLGNSLLFSTMNGEPSYAIPTGLGGIAGEALHPLALGNVLTFKELLSSQEAKDTGLGDIKIIGVGGVTCKAAAIRMKKAGADVIGCATLFGKKGVKAFEILQ